MIFAMSSALVPFGDAETEAFLRISLRSATFRAFLARMHQRARSVISVQGLTVWIPSSTLSESNLNATVTERDD